MRIKTKNVEESIEPVGVDKAGSEASEERTDGLSKMFAVLGYSKVCVYKSVHISTRGFVSAQYKCREFLDPVNIGICPENFYTARSARQKGCVNRLQLSPSYNSSNRLLVDQSERSR